MKLWFKSLFILVGVFTCNLVYADDADDFAALNLAVGIKPAAASTPSDWKMFAEAASGQTLVRGLSNFQGNQRISIDLQYDANLSESMRAFISNRLDVNWPQTIPGNNESNTATALLQSSNAINTFREGYVTWQVNPAQHLDVGRINALNGVGVGYNPTDYFKVGALRSIVSINPFSLKENRQGSVMFRSQQLWGDGAVSFLYSPKLAAQANESPLSLDLGATNNQDKMLLQLTHKIYEGFSPQILIFKSGGSSPQFGLNLTGLVNNSTTAYLEWSGGRSLSLIGQAISQQGIQYAGSASFNNQLSTGMTYTTMNKISMTGEIEFNSAGLNNPKWSNLGNLAPVIYEGYRKYLQEQQESPTKSSAFLFLKWEDAGIRNLDLSAMQRFDLIDTSRMLWFEARYHLHKTEFALQWQRNIGSEWSNYGAIPQAETIQLLCKYYL